MGLGSARVITPEDRPDRGRCCPAAFCWQLQNGYPPSPAAFLVLGAESLLMLEGVRIRIQQFHWPYETFATNVVMNLDLVGVGVPAGAMLVTKTEFNAPSSAAWRP